MPESARSARSAAGPADTCARLAATNGTHRLSGLTLFPSPGTSPNGDRTIVTVSGQLDLATSRQLQHALRSVPTGSDGGVRLDLNGVEFCDCSAVNILLSINQPIAHRTATATEPEADADDELLQLRRAMQSRGTIDLARGILMAAFAISPKDAWRVLVTTSQNTNTKLRRVAEQVVESAEGTALPEDVREQLSTAIAELTDRSGNGSGTAAAATTAGSPHGRQEPPASA